MKKPLYLDCNATTPPDPQVLEVLWRHMTEDFGNEGSRTHEYGTRAKQAVQRAREQVAAVVQSQREEVIFTSGATESNNLAILGLSDYGIQHGKRHVICSAIEHKSVLEPIDELRRRGFEVTTVATDKSGRVRAEAIRDALRPDTLLVSIMQANNETGIIQPIKEIAAVLERHDAYFHTDAAQGFGKELESLKNPRIDLISISGHKIYAPKGIGALITRRRGFRSPELKPLMFGGGQERRLRPGTLPVALIAALGAASEVAVKDFSIRRKRILEVRDAVMGILKPFSPVLTGEEEHRLPHTLNLGIMGINSEALMVTLKEHWAISNGSACTSSSYEPSYVLKAMGYTDAEAKERVRISWSHLTEIPEAGPVRELIHSII